MSDYFKQSLVNFTTDFASGDAIRSLADKGMSTDEIERNLTYPTPLSVIKDVVWKHYINTGVIRLEKPDKAGNVQVNTEFVLERDRYGKSSYRKVEKIISDNPARYVACDFGRQIYQDKERFAKSLSVLDKKDRNYILGLPWPIETVYHICDERMSRIKDVLKMQ